jgi:hypothetical protein
MAHCGRCHARVPAENVTLSRGVTCPTCGPIEATGLYWTNARPPASRWPIVIDPFFYCWLWTGPVAGNGYPIVREGSREWAHRAVYELEVGSIPEAHVLDHLCRRPKCVSPAHLEPVTKDDNERAKAWRARARRALCAKGHAMAIEAMVTPEGGRVCRTCSRSAA